MKTTVNNPPCSLLLVVLVLYPLSSYSSAGKKEAKTSHDINAIGHRVIGYQSGYGNWYSLDKEKQIGAQLSAEYEKSTPLIRDEATQVYLDGLTRAISQNSDTQFSITTRVLDREDSFALTLAGGYQYVSHGLLLQMENESELAAVIARGIAHTSLRSATGLATRANLMKIMTVPLTFGGPEPTASSTSNDGLSVPLTLLRFRREDESAADYFGVQYLCKSGYSPEGFISFIQKVWISNTPGTSKAFSAFPTLSERLEALRREIQEILPKQSTAVTNTQNFVTFREHLLTVAPPKPLPKNPILLRRDPQRLD